MLGFSNFIQKKKKLILKSCMCQIDLISSIVLVNRSIG
jgi:hypothetical protein